MTLNQALLRCMKCPERYVLQIDYVSIDKTNTRRVISPIRYGSQKLTVYALCLSREQCRQFVLAQIKAFTLLDANDILMPVEIIVLQARSASE